jgi:hypothetical protein
VSGKELRNYYLLTFRQFKISIPGDEFCMEYFSTVQSSDLCFPFLLLHLWVLVEGLIGWLAADVNQWITLIF